MDLYNRLDLTSITLASIRSELQQESEKYSNL